MLNPLTPAVRNISMKVMLQLQCMYLMRGDTRGRTVGPWRRTRRPAAASCHGTRWQHWSQSRLGAAARTAGLRLAPAQGSIVCLVQGGDCTQAVWCQQPVLAYTNHTRAYAMAWESQVCYFPGIPLHPSAYVMCETAVSQGSQSDSPQQGAPGWRRLERPHSSGSMSHSAGSARALLRSRAPAPRTAPGALPPCQSTADH